MSNNNHRLYNGDNLIIMSEINSEFENKIDLCYIDPPYNTGKKMGKYSDNFSSHDKWVAFMEPRLLQVKDMLSEQGTIWISIGEKEEAYLKILCNKIFGEKNKVASITWQSKYTVANDKKRGISSQTEYILVYAKCASKCKLNADPLRKEYVAKTYKNLDNDPRGLWRGGIQLYKKKNKHSYKVTSPTGKEWTMPWNYSKKQWHDVLEKNDLIWWGKDGNSCPVKKVFLKDTKGIAIKDLWLGEEVGYTADGGDVLEDMLGNRNEFLYPKPVSLMKRILQVASQKDSIVFDFFCGSGTMGQAVLEYNCDDGGQRQAILINNDENEICSKVAKPRLEKTIAGYVGKDGKKHPPTGGVLEYIME